MSEGFRRGTWLAAAMLVMQTASAFAQSAAVPPRLVTREWTVDGVPRTGLVAGAVNPVAEAGSPLVLVFHGHGGKATNMSTEFAIHAAWPEAVVIYLQGLPTPGRITDAAGRFAGWQSTPGSSGDRDIKLVDAVIAWAAKEHRIDAKRIYAAGHSNGGSFTYVLWTTRGDRFAAFAPAASVFGQMITAAKPKPAMIVAGERDRLVPIVAQRRTIAAVRRLNQVDTTAIDWGPHARLYRSRSGADVLVYIHPGAHPMPKDAAALTVRFFKAH